MRLLAVALALAACQETPAAKTGWEPIARARIQDEHGAALAGCRVQVVGCALFQAFQPYRIQHATLRVNEDGILAFDAAEASAFVLLVEEPTGLVTALGPFERSWFFTGERTIELPPLHEGSGILHDAAGQPVDGARLFPFSYEIPHIYWGPLAPLGSRLEEDEDFPWRVEGGAQVGGWAQSVISMLASSPDGSFRFLTRIPEPRLGVLNQEGLPFILPWPDPENHAVLRLPELREQVVVVQDPAGTPIANAEVRVARVSVGDWAVFSPIGATDARGTVRTTVTAREGWGDDEESGVIVYGPPGYCSERDSFGTTRSPGPVVLDPEFLLKVRVQNHAGEPLSGCDFEVLTWASLDAEGPFPPRGQRIAGVSELAPGEYLMLGKHSLDEPILAFHEDYLFGLVELETDDWANLVQDADGLVTGTADLPRPISASFYIQDAVTGMPLRGASVRLMLSMEANWSSWELCQCPWSWGPLMAQGFTDADGHWESPGVCADIFNALSVTHPNGQRMVLPLAGLSRGSRIPFRSETRTVTGTLTQFGRPLSGFELEFRRQDAGDGSEELLCRTNERGHYSISLPTPDHYEVSGKPVVDFYMGHYSLRHDAFIDGDRLDIAVEQEFTPIQGPSGRLRGSFSVDGVPAQGGIGIALLTSDADDQEIARPGAGYSLFLDENGAFEVEIPAGEFKIWLGYITPGAAPAEELRGVMRPGEVLDVKELGSR